MSELIGHSVAQPDGLVGAAGEYELGADLAAEGMLWAAIVRSPHPHATIRRIDPTPALTMARVHAVVTHADVPGLTEAEFGAEHPDEPVFAGEVVRYVGEPVAAVAAERPDLANEAAAALDVEYDPLPPLINPDEAVHAAEIHPDGNLIRHIVVRHGAADARGEVAVEGTYEVGSPAPAAVDPVAGLALPLSEGGVELRWPSLAPESDRAEVARCLRLEPDQVRYVAAGLGGEPGPRHDIGVQVALCVLAMQAWRPVKIVLSGADGQLLRASRHPARMWYRHHADLSGTLVRIEARLLFDGGAYATTSGGMLATACGVAAGPYAVPDARIDGLAVRTNRPPTGGLRGDGSAQVCFAYEAQMDKLAVVLGLDPIQLRLRNALTVGDRLVTGQEVTAPVPVAELIQACSEPPLPGRHRIDQLSDLPGGHGRTSERTAVRRGVGVAVGVAGVLAADGVDGQVRATIRLDGDSASVVCGHPETGQGFVTAVHQVVCELLGVRRVVVERPSGDGWTSGPYWLAGRGLLTLEAVAESCREIEKRRASGEDGAIEASAVIEQPPTSTLDIDGQGEPFARLAFAAHRAVVDVDVELGLVRVVDMTVAQHTGRILNPPQLRTRIETGIAQGIGLTVAAGDPVGRSDAPWIRLASLLEDPDPASTLGAVSAGDPPIVVSPAAVAAAIRDAAGVAVVKLPVRPDDVAAVPRP